MKKHAIINRALLVMLLFLLMSSIVAVNAQSDDDDDDDDDTTTTTTDDDQEDDDDDDPNERQLEVEVTATQAQIKSKLESGANEYVFKVEVETGLNGLEFKVSYEEENASTETEKEFEVKFKELVEFIDDNGNGVYDDETDTEIQTVNLSNFDPIQYSILNGTSGQLHVFDVSTSDGIFMAQLYASGTFTEVNGTVIAPNEVKIDVMIHDFNFTADDSLLALKVTLEASTETEFDEETEDEQDGRATDEEEIEILATDYPGFFSWKETADIDGVTYPVNASIYAGEFDSNEQKIYLNYPQGNEIIHDPKLGFANVLIDPSAMPPVVDAIVNTLGNNLVPIAAVASVVIIGLVVVSKRRV